MSAGAVASAGAGPVLDPTAAQTGAEPAAVVLLSRWSPADAEALSRHARSAGVTRVPIRLDGGLVLLGPVQHPGGRVCLGCAERTRLRVFGPDVPSGEAGLRLGGWLVPGILPGLAALAAGMLAAPERHDDVVVALRGDHATVTTHRVRPDPRGCPSCAPLPADHPDRVRVRLVPTPTVDPYRLRGANPRTSRQELRAALYDFRHGPVARLRRTEQAALALVTAELAGDRPLRDAGHGRSGDFAQAERVALFEAVERMTGNRPHGRRTVLTASFAQLGPDRAVDPVRLGLPDPGYADHPRSRVVPYTPDVTTRWVYGWSLPADRAVAVPEHVAYWGVLPTAEAPHFVGDNSNGCGLGNSLVEAVLYGLFEIVERDAFLMAWYARTPLRRVRVPDADPVLPHLADRLEQLGYDLLLFDATNDLDIPVVLALAHHRDPGSGAPQAFFAAGAHPDPRAAMRAAVAEVVVDVLALPDHIRSRPGHLDPDRLLPMLAEPERVVTIDDHVALHTRPEARPRYAFLLDGSPVDGSPVARREPRSWSRVWPGRPRPVPDLAALLAGIVDRFAAAGLEIIVVDQTHPELRERLGLYSAKVIVPGTLPMTFGHINHRTRGLRRLCQVPYQLGRLPAPVRYEDLDLHPHPFP